MANFVYKKAKEAFLNGNLNLLSNQLKVLLLNNSEYTPNQDTDEFVSNIPSTAVVKRSEAISSVTTTNGVLDGGDLTIIEYDGSAFDAIAMYQSGTSDSNSRLIFYISDSEGLPFSGLNSVSSITIFWSDSSTKILSI
jgi:hypothetical protein